MSSDRSVTTGLADGTPTVIDAEENAGIRAGLAVDFTWPSRLRSVTRPLEDLGAVMDLDALAKAAASAANIGAEVCFTLISKEYIETGLNWIRAMQRLGLSNFIVIAGDQLTHETIDRTGVRSVRVRIDEDAFDGSFVAQTGFSTKGLAITALKFPVTRFLLACGYSVTFSDADAVWLRDPMQYVTDADVAFQRVIYHPPSISSLWGFSACSGFVVFRHGTRTIAFVDQCIKAHQSFHCDQVAFNVALVEGGPAWRCEEAAWSAPAGDAWHDQSVRRSVFGTLAPFAIRGELRNGGARLLALPHDKFWRHAWVGMSMEEMVVCHPNSPKDDIAKMRTLHAIGAQFPPRADGAG